MTRALCAPFSCATSHANPADFKVHAASANGPSAPPGQPPGHPSAPAGASGAAEPRLQEVCSQRGPLQNEAWDRVVISSLAPLGPSLITRFHGAERRVVLMVMMRGDKWKQHRYVCQTELVNNACFPERLQLDSYTTALTATPSHRTALRH